MDLEILKIASNTENNKIIKNFTHSSKHKNPLCGDEMEISLKINNNIILNFGYQCKSCIYCQASVSLLSRNSINQSMESLMIVINLADIFFEKENLKFPSQWSSFNKLFHKKNISRKECLKLPFKTLFKALQN